ncbi:MAG: sortase [Chloroflexi bacterium]|nr:sortase [Chloroflexota bacterium]
MLHRLRVDSRSRRWLSYLAICMGGLVIAAGVSYLIYARVARSGLPSLEYTVPAEQRSEWDLGPAMPTRTPTKAAATAVPVVGESPAAPTATAGAVSASAAVEFPRLVSSSLYPAAWTNPKYWIDPFWAGADPYGGSGLPDGFRRVNARDISLGPGTTVAASRMHIQAVNLDAKVIDLAILDLEDSRAYETPNNVAGHIPGTANPGEAAMGWYFGHLESLVRGEGSVFRNLTRIPDLIKEDPVDIVVQSDEGEFLYRVTGTRVVHEDELRLEDSAYPTITLVACVPAKVYDHRLLVSAELIAIRP